MTKPLTLPSGGGAWVRETDGSLRLDEPPTAREPGPEAVPGTPVETPVQPPVKRSVKEA